MTALALGLGAVCLEAHAETYPWSQVVDSERLKIWRRESPTSSIKEVKVDMLLDAPVERVWEVLRDVEHYHEFMPYVAEASLLREHGDTRIVYERFSAPIIADRDVTLRIVSNANPVSRVYGQEFSVAADEGPPPIEGVVRIALSNGQWRLQVDTPSTTRVIYHIHTDPGGYIPHWLVNFMQSRGVGKFTHAVETRATNPDWTHSAGEEVHSFTQDGSRER